MLGSRYITEIDGKKYDRTKEAKRRVKQAERRLLESVERGAEGPTIESNDQGNTPVAT